MKRSKKRARPATEKVPAKAPDKPTFRSAVPGEFEHQEALVFGCGQLVRYFPQMFVDFVRAAHESVQLKGIISPEWRKLADLLIGAAGLPADCVEFIEGKTSSAWSRDWSPTFAYDPNGNRCQIYFNRSQMRHRDDVVAREIFTRHFPGAQVDVDLMMEGGNILSNGHGLVITSNTVEITNSGKYDRGQIAKTFETVLNSNQWASIMPLYGERTGHVDLFATFLAPDFLVIGEVDKNEDELSAHSLDDAAQKLNGIDTNAGKLTVARIPMPTSRDTFFRSYNNVIFANKTLLVPSYPMMDPKLDQRVLDIYREYLPGYEVKGIDMGELDRKDGALHCLSTNVPPEKRI